MRYEGGYLLPRGDGRYVLGATVEERGFELTPTAGGVYELLRDARELVPGVTELELEEVSVGLRPGSPDNAPLIGRGALEGLILATGHHRNGILLAPLTAELTLGLLDGAARAEDHERAAGDLRPGALREPLRGAGEARRSVRGGAAMIILNGERSEVPGGATVASVLAELGLRPGRAGGGRRGRRRGDPAGALGVLCARQRTRAWRC